MKMMLKGIFGAGGSIIGVLGIVLSIYFYHAQKQFKALAFLVDPRRTLLVSPDRLPSSRLTLFDQDGKRVTRDVYSAQIYLWNNGTETILGTDVIVPLIIDIPKPDQLLDLQTTYVSRQDVTGVALTLKKRDGTDALQFTFRVLEPGDGIRVSLLYEGNKDAEFILKGGITGIREITDSKGLAHQERWSAPWKKYFNVMFVPMLIAGFVGVVFLIGALWSLVSKRWFPKQAQIVGTVIAIAFWVPALLALLGALVYGIIDPWLHPEKVIQENITDYIPTELKKN